LRSAVNALRNVLEPERPNRAPSSYIYTQAPGYAYRSHPNLWLDVEAFEQHLDEAARLPAAEDRRKHVEAALALSPADGWRIELNAAYTAAEFGAFNENLGTGVISRKGKTPSNVPEWVSNAFVSKRFASGLTFSGGPRYVGERFGNTNNSVIAKAYTAIDAAVSYPWHRATITLRGRNLLDADYEPVAGTTIRRLADPISAELSLRTSF
jgi:outer membrane receptor protein involved in Fe transport